MTNHHFISRKCPEEFLQGLFGRTPHNTALRNLKMSKAVLDGLKPRDFKQEAVE
jgi:hypothetical protein